MIHATAGMPAHRIISTHVRRVLIIGASFRFFKGSDEKFFRQSPAAATCRFPDGLPGVRIETLAEFDMVSLSSSTISRSAVRTPRAQSKAEAPASALQAPRKYALRRLDIVIRPLAGTPPALTTYLLRRRSEPQAPMKRFIERSA
jgi:hypothetical protein